MADLIFRSGKKGRPIKIDPEEALDKFLQLETPATARLQWYKQTSQGVRFDSSNLGTKAIMATRDVLEALDNGEQINYETARELKQNLRTIERLASKQARVYETALSDALTRQYEQDIAFQQKGASKLAKRIYQAQIQTVKNLTKRQQTAFFTSSSYQDPKTNIRSGSPQLEERVYAWVENETGTRLGREETLAYIELDKTSMQTTGMHLAERGITLDDLEL